MRYPNGRGTDACRSTARSSRGGLLERAVAVAWLSVVLLALAGCGGMEYQGVSSAGAPQSPATMAGGGAAAAATATGTARPVSATPRKLIYNSEVELVAESLGAAERSLLQLVKAHGGFVANTAVTGSTGTPRTGRWTVRVPVEQFEQFMAAVAKVGELQKVQTNSQDVTEEFYDLGARLSNKQVEEQRLVAHLKGSTARLQDILSVERELSRVRGEIEQIQGRLRLLADQTDLSTVNVTINEVKDFAPKERTTFTAQIGRTFGSSLGFMRDVGQGIVLVIVALAPWLVLLALVGLPVWLFVRRYWMNTAG